MSDLKQQEVEQLPGGCIRLMLSDTPGRPETVWQRFKRRMPDKQLITQFWRPTTCRTCYWLRLAKAATFGVICGHWIIWPLMVVSFGYALREKETPKGEVNG